MAKVKKFGIGWCIPKEWQLMIPSGVPTSCLLMDPKPHVFKWTLDDFLGPSIDIRFLGPPKDMSAQTSYVF